MRLRIYLIVVIVAFLPGCMITRGVFYNIKEDASVIRVDQAFFEGNDLIVDYVIAPTRKAKSSSSSQEARQCGSFLIPNILTLSHTIDKNNDVPVGHVYRGDCRTPFISNRHIPPDRQVAIVNTPQPLDSDNLPTKFVYFNKDSINEFYYIDKSGDTKTTKGVILQAGNLEYMPWYGPVLFIMAPIAVIADVVTFPIQAIICGGFGEYCPVDP